MSNMLVVVVMLPRRALSSILEHNRVKDVNLSGKGQTPGLNSLGFRRTSEFCWIHRRDLGT